MAGNCQAPKMTNKHLKSIITVVNMTYEHKTRVQVRLKVKVKVFFGLTLNMKKTSFVFNKMNSHLGLMQHLVGIVWLNNPFKIISIVTTKLKQTFIMIWVRDDVNVISFSFNRIR